MWSEAIGLGMSLFGGLKSSKEAKRAAKQRAREFDEMRKQSGYLRYMAEIANQERLKENDYIRGIEKLNRATAEQERQFRMDQLFRDQGLLAEEYQQEIDRRLEMDREAARVQQLHLEKYLRDQEINAEERAFAEEQLDYVKQIAAGEREEDMRRFYEEKATKEAERDFMMSQFELARTAIADDQARDLALHDRVSGQIGDMQRALRMAEIEMGAPPELQRLTKADLDAEISRRQDQYMSDVDRAADRMASINEANLIRGGIDAATPGTARRGDVTRRIADEYQSARSRAYDDALSYITGQQDMYARDYGGQMERRKDVLGEIAGIESAGLQELMNMPQVRSLADAMGLAPAVPSAMHARSIASANSFGAPVDLGSRVTQGVFEPGLAQTRIGGSQVGANWGGVGTAITNPSSLDTLDVGTLLGASLNGQQNLFSAADRQAGNARDRNSDAWGNFGDHFQKFGSDHGDTIWNWLTGADKEAGAT